MKFRNLTEEARKVITDELGIDPRLGLNEDQKARFEESFRLASVDGSEVITADHVRRAFAV